jgi:hypothetical protein
MEEGEGKNWGRVGSFLNFFATVFFGKKTRKKTQKKQKKITHKKKKKKKTKMAKLLVGGEEIELGEATADPSRLAAALAACFGGRTVVALRPNLPEDAPHGLCGPCGPCIVPSFPLDIVARSPHSFAAPRRHEPVFAPPPPSGPEDTHLLCCAKGESAGVSLWQTAAARGLLRRGFAVVTLRGAAGRAVRAAVDGGLENVLGPAGPELGSIPGAGIDCNGRKRVIHIPCAELDAGGAGAESIAGLFDDGHRQDHGAAVADDGGQPAATWRGEAGGGLGGFVWDSMGAQGDGGAAGEVLRRAGLVLRWVAVECVAAVLAEQHEARRQQRGAAAGGDDDGDDVAAARADQSAAVRDVVDPGTGERMTMGSAMRAFRYLGEPPEPDATAGVALLCPEHADTSLVTAMPCSDVAGLEVWDVIDAQGVRPEIADDARGRASDDPAGTDGARIIVFAGTQLGGCPAPVHRVFFPDDAPAPRHSLPLFLRARAGTEGTAFSRIFASRATPEKITG